MSSAARPLTNTERTVALEPIQLRLLERIARRLTSILELDPLLTEIVGDIATTLGYSRSAVLLLDESTNEVVVVAARGWHVSRMSGRFRVGQEGMVGKAAALGRTIYAPDVTKEPSYIPCESSSRSEVDIPLRSHGKVIGVFDAQHPEPNAFSDSTIQLLESVASYIAIAIENARSFQRERAEKEKVQRELHAARVVQKSLRPSLKPPCRGFEIAGTCDACGAVAGDWYDFFHLPDGRTAVALADVSGKGASAALLMASTRSVLRMVAAEHEQPAAVLQHVNAVLVEDFPDERFVTMVYGVLDPEKKTFTFANAGHFAPIVCNASGPGTVVDSDNGLPLGIFNQEFKETTVAMPAGTVLLLFSDGVTETVGENGEEFGLGRLCRSVTGDASVEKILGDLKTFRGTAAASDDVSLVVVKSVSG